MADLQLLTHVWLMLTGASHRGGHFSTNRTVDGASMVNPYQALWQRQHENTTRAVLIPTVAEAPPVIDWDAYPAGAIN